jgi:hypothetical protein
MLCSDRNMFNDRSPAKAARVAVAKRHIAGAAWLSFAVVLLLPARDAQADAKKIAAWQDNKTGYDWEVWYDPDTDVTSVFVWITKTDAIMEQWHKGVPINPNPDGESSGPKGDQSTQIALAKQKGGGDGKVEGDFWKSPAGQLLTGGGKGPNVVWNPEGDQGGPSAGATYHTIGQKPGQLLIGNTGAGLQDLMDRIKDKVKEVGGAAGKYLENHGKGPGPYWNPGVEGGGGGSQNDGGGDDEPPGSPRQGGELGPKPDIVNPPTVQHHLGGLFARHVSDPDDKYLGGPDTKHVPNAFVLLPPTTKGFKLNGPAGGLPPQSASFNRGAFGGPSTAAEGARGAMRMAR